MHAHSLLALARARKASWPALKFSFLPPHALRADACEQRNAGSRTQGAHERFGKWHAWLIAGTQYTVQLASRGKPKCRTHSHTSTHLQRAAKGEGEGPGLVDTLHLVHGGEVSSGLLLGLAACRRGGKRHSTGP
jgi:hypothetical protein